MFAELDTTYRSYDTNGQRYHELALAHWFNKNFYVMDGYPVPVLFTSPMDAYSHFSELWTSVSGSNPFQYILDAKDENGKQLYLPHPAPAPYPIISIHRKSDAWRAEQSYSIHRWRRLAWVTETTSGTNTLDQLGRVAQAQMPMGWDFVFQVDFHCLRPDTAAKFIQHLMRKMRRAGGTPQTWITVAYPYYGRMFARSYIQDGSIQHMNPEVVPDAQITVYRTTFNLVMEGWVPDIQIELVPAFWTLILNMKTAIAPGVLETLYSETTDLRSTTITNPVMADPNRGSLPPVE